MTTFKICATRISDPRFDIHESNLGTENELRIETASSILDDISTLAGSVIYAGESDTSTVQGEIPVQDNCDEIVAEEETDSKSVTKPENRKFFEIDIGEKFSLASEVESFEKSRDYRVIGHFSWFQPIAEEDSSIPLLIETDKFKGSKIFGTLNVYKKRFLHSDFNFFLADEVEESESQELRLFLTRESPEEYVILSKEDSMKLNYQLKQSRKLKSGELHYIDHPKFGIIYRIVKTEKIEQS